jgi:diguanylate cyclase
MELKKLSHLIMSSENILIQKVLGYAKAYDYVKYTSTLTEAWRQSIAGLSEAMVKCMRQSDCIPELNQNEDFTQGEIALFGIEEAKKHRLRGITITMFLGLMKYYQQSYLDLVNEENDFLFEEKQYFLLYIRRYFDRVELGFISEWTSSSQDKKLLFFQEMNRKMTNEKNKYLTIFESIYDPIILVDKENNIENINYQAANIFWGIPVSGSKYYSNLNTNTELDWLKQELDYFIGLKQDEVIREKVTETKYGQKTFQIKMKKMLDISEKYSGTVIIFNDITERLKVEKQLQKQYKELEFYAYIDPMTGALNRRTGLVTLEKEINLLDGNNHKLAIAFIDIDGLKAVNDTYGHMDGDELIINIIRTLQTVVGEENIVSRMGGDEFLIIAPGSDEEKLSNVMEQVVSKLADYDKTKTKPYNHSFSYGIIEVSTYLKNDINELIKLADQKMYQHKLRKKG